MDGTDPPESYMPVSGASGGQQYQNPLILYNYMCDGKHICIPHMTIYHSLGAKGQGVVVLWDIIKSNNREA